jgi:putative endonuclease
MCQPTMWRHKTQMSFYVYILLCCDGSFYTGYTKDLDTRTKQHQNGNGARYTKSHKPKNLVYFETHDSRSKAMKREREIKKLSHDQKNNLVNSQKNE